MKGTDFNIEALHKIQYEILLELDRVCKKHGIKYYLAYGTLLGAIRQNGFIPWDDDIDTMMSYDDFEKLKQIDPKEWRHPYFLQCFESDKQYRRCFAKLRNSETTLVTKELEHLDINQGVDVDIYPFVNLADDPEDRKRQYRDTMIYMLLTYDEPPRNHGQLYYAGSKIILSLIPKWAKTKLLEKYKKRVLRYQDIQTEEVYTVNGNIEIMRQPMKSNWFSESVDCMFETKEFPIPIGAHEWMRSRYGDDYMLPPPESKRGIKFDTFVIIDLEKPYSEYKGIAYCTEKKRTQKVKNNRWVNDNETIKNE